MLSSEHGVKPVFTFIFELVWTLIRYNRIINGFRIKLRYQGGSRMKTNDEIFYKEFRDMMNSRKASGRSFNLVDVPLLEFKGMTTGTPKRHFALVRSIKEKFFERLNTTEVQLVGRTTLRKRQVMSNGEFRKDAEGRYEYVQITVPNTSVAILSRLSIGLKRFYEEDGRKIEHKVSKGFRYVDYTTIGGERHYIYIVPKEYVYRLNMCALVLTPNKRRTYYQGCKLALQDGTYLYLYVVPHKYRDSTDARELGVKSTCNFSVEMNEIVKYWMSLGVIFDLRVTSLEGQVNGISNVGFTMLEGTMVSEDYKRYGVSLKDEKEDDLI